jgi:hypothetical protein
MVKAILICMLVALVLVVDVGCSSWMAWTATPQTDVGTLPAGPKAPPPMARYGILILYIAAVILIIGAIPAGYFLRSPRMGGLCGGGGLVIFCAAYFLELYARPVAWCVMACIVVVLVWRLICVTKAFSITVKQIDAAEADPEFTPDLKPLKKRFALTGGQFLKDEVGKIKRKLGT